jgi:hypothetical protein
MTSTDSASTGSKEIDGLIEDFSHQDRCEALGYGDSTDADVQRARGLLAAAISRLVQQRDEAQKDAERYRWLRRYHDDSPDQRLRVWEGPPWDQSAVVWWREGLDEQIDAALARASEGEK